MNILLGVTGSVAATLTRKMQNTIREQGHELMTVVTESAKNFQPSDDKDIDKFWLGYYEDKNEWSHYKEFGYVLHINLVKWADVFIIAPCTANTLAKIFNGICDNLLTNCVKAWDYDKKIIIAPAMNCNMYTNPPTKNQIKLMKDHGIVFCEPQIKKLFCGDEGIGAMANIETIIKAL